MAVRFDEETIDRLRGMAPRDAYYFARDAVFATEDAGSEDFLDAYGQLVDHGILSWDQVEEFDPRPSG